MSGGKCEIISEHDSILLISYNAGSQFVNQCGCSYNYQLSLKLKEMSLRLFQTEKIRRIQLTDQDGACSHYSLEVDEVDMSDKILTFRGI